MWAMNTPGVIWFLVTVLALLFLDVADGLPVPWPVVILTVAVATAIVWLALKWSWFRWNPSKHKYDRFQRAIAAGTAGALVVGAYLAFSSPTHDECTQEIRTRDGTECVGEYVTVEGGDVQLGVVALGLAVVAFRVSMASRKTEQ